MEPLLRVQGLSVDRPDGRPLFAGFDLDVEAGEIVVVGGRGARIARPGAAWT